MSSNILDNGLDFITSIPNLPLIALLTTFLALLAPIILLSLLAYTQQDIPTSPPPGCRKLNLQGQSNLSDQYDKKYSQGTDAGTDSSGNPLWKVEALFIYPLKSCARVELDKAEVIRTGLRYDRQFSFAQQVTGLPSLEGKVESEWNFITQRTFPRLVKVETEVWVPDPSAAGYSAEAEFVKSEGCFVIRFPFTPDVEMSVEGLRALGKILAARWKGKQEPMVEFRIPFNPSRERMMEMKYTSEKMKIWKDKPEALNMCSEIPADVLAKLKYTLGVTNPLTLFRIDTEKYREVFKCAPKKEDVGFQPIIGMADSYPLHILNLASVHHVSSQRPKETQTKPLSALRYRANMYITGPPAFAEDNWTRARIGSCNYHISCRTTRCKLPNVDPETGIKDARNEPEKTMRKYRIVDPGSKSACLGMQLTPLEDGEVRVGDGVVVLETGEHFYLRE